MQNINQDVIKYLSSKMKFKLPYSYEDYAQHLYFENYHCHKDFSNTSTPDSGELATKYVDRIKELDGKCLFTTEHGCVGNPYYIYTLAEKSKLKYRHSAEVYWVTKLL